MLDVKLVRDMREFIFSVMYDRFKYNVQHSTSLSLDFLVMILTTGVTESGCRNLSYL